MDVLVVAPDNERVLLERDAQLAALADYAAEAERGSGRLVLISGEAGIGKTALVEMFERRAASLRFARGGCDGLFTPRALSPLYDVAADLGGRLAEACAQEHPREELFGVLLEVLREQPTVLVLEDVHWADEATLDLIRFLGRRLATTPALVLVSYRDDGLTATDPLRIVLGELGTQRTTRRIDLAPLSRLAVDQLARQVAASGSDLHRLTGGNPFFVTELLRGGLTAGTVPPSARDVVLARVARLSDSARRTAEAAALLGTRIDLEVLHAVASPPDRDLDELVTTGLLVSEPAGLRFRHELTRQTISQEIPAHRARAVHAAALATLVDRAGDDARLAYHAEGAADAQAVQWFAPRAAEQSAALGAHREAVAQLERALRFTDGLAAKEVAALWTQLSVEAGLVDRWQDASAAIEAALELWRQIGDPLRVGEALRHQATAHWRLCLPDAAESAREAIATLAPLGKTPELAWALARGSVFEPTPAAMVDRAREARELALELDLPDVASDALNTQACALWNMGAPDWEAPMVESLRLAQETRSDAQAGRAFANYQALLGEANRWAEHDRISDEGMAYCEQHDIATFGYCIRAGLGDALLRRSRWDEAVSYAQPLVDLQASPVNTITPLVDVGLAKARRDLPGGLADLDRAVTLGDQTESLDWMVVARVPRAEAHLLAGDLDAARADLVACHGPQLETLGPNFIGGVMLWSRRAGLDLPAVPDRAVPEPVRLLLDGRVREAVAYWDERELPYDAAWALVDSGEPDAAREALARFEALGAVAAARLARQELRNLGADSVPRGARAVTRAHPAGLTAREHEVLTLLSGGLTDEQIAGQLVLSVRTVHHHVSAVLGKLGASSRREAAELAERRGLLAV